MPGKARGKHQEKRLTAAHLRKPAPGRHADGNGLYLEVDPSGAARWVQRLMVHGRRRDIGVGPLALVKLGEAREAAEANRKLARAGGDPIAAKRARIALAGGTTFKAAALECHDLRKGKWRNEKHRAQWLSSLEAYAFPKIGGMPVHAVSSADVMDVLTPIWTEKAETARRVKHRIGLVLDYARAKGWRETGSPTHELARALPKVPREKRHQPAMPYAEIPAFLSRLAETGASDATKAALEVLILCAARTGEVLGARWAEFDLDKAIWTVLGERMKGGKPHAVPLSPRALALFKARRAAHSGKGDFVFEAKPGKPLSQMTLLMAMRRMKLDFVPHGFRSSFRDFAAERTNAPREVAEAALAHAVGNAVEAAYRRTDLLDKRRKLMATWAAHCAGGGGKVVLLKRDAAVAR